MESTGEGGNESGGNINLRAFSVVGYILLIVSFLPLLYAGSVLLTSPTVSCIQFLAIGLMIWARLMFGTRSFHLVANPTEGGLVTTGPYRYIRHPIYASVLYFAWAGILGNPTLMNIALGCGMIVGAWMRIIAEERLVVTKYPEYAEYGSRTKRVIPFLL